MADQQGAAAANQQGGAAEEQRYFCYQCNKDVAVEGSQGAMTCVECQGGFLEAIATVTPEFRPRETAREAAVSIDEAIEHMYPDQLAQMVQALMAITRDLGSRGPIPPPTPEEGEVQGEVHFQEGDGHENEGFLGGYDSETGLRVELEGMDGNENEEEDEWEEADDEERVALAAAARDAAERDDGGRTGPFSDFVRQMVQNLLDRNVEIRFDLPEIPVGNPGDYLDARGFDQFLQHLAENDNSNKGAPPASKSAIDSLKMVKVTQSEIDTGEAVCAVCKEPLLLDEPVKQLPCLHVYHPDCILPWLNTRNSCPVCRYELPTDDPDYEEQKKSRRAYDLTGLSGLSDLHSTEGSSGGGVPAQDVNGAGGSSGDECRDSGTETNENHTVENGSSSEAGVAATAVEAEETTSTDAEATLKPEEAQDTKSIEAEEPGAEEAEEIKSTEADEEPGSDSLKTSHTGLISRSWLLLAVGPVVSVLGLLVAGHLSGLLDGVQSRVFQQLLG